MRRRPIAEVIETERLDARDRQIWEKQYGRRCRCPEPEVVAKAVPQRKSFQRRPVNR